MQSRRSANTASMLQPDTGRRRSPAKERQDAADALAHVEALLPHPWRAAYPAEAEWPRTKSEGMPTFLMSGFAARAYRLPSGRKQMLSLVLPGDIVSYAGRATSLPWTTTIALTPVVLCGARAGAKPADPAALDELLELVEQRAALERSWLCLHAVRLGGMPAYERTAHLLLELESRLATTGLAQDGEYAMPLIQDTLAELLGMSVTHLNRILQQLRKEGRLVFKRSRVRLTDRADLARDVDFEPPRTVDHLRAVEGVPLPDFPLAWTPEGGVGRRLNA